MFWRKKADAPKDLQALPKWCPHCELTIRPTDQHKISCPSVPLETMIGRFVFGTILVLAIAGVVFLVFMLAMLVLASS
jgi:hypothetical protein